MRLYKGKTERPKGRHSECVDCFAIKSRLVEDGLRQTNGCSKIAPKGSARAIADTPTWPSPRAARYPRLEEDIRLVPVQVLPLSFGEGPNINLLADLYSHLL
jgi:hypothetical protein